MWPEAQPGQTGQAEHAQQEQSTHLLDQRLDREAAPGRACKDATLVHGLAIGRRHGELAYIGGAGLVGHLQHVAVDGAEEQHPKMSTDELVNLIKALGRIPVERDTLYGIVKTYA